MEKIKEILKRLRPEFNFEASSDFIEDGFLDSFDIVQIVSEFEETFGIVVDGLDILPQNFNSFEAMAALIRKSGGKI